MTAVGRWTRRALVANLMVQVLIVVTGGLVRLTGSGLGCPTWPECDPGSLTPQAEAGVHASIEFGNRLLTGLVGLVALVALVAVLAHRPFRRPLALLAVAPLVGVAVQALLGGVTVLTGLHPATVAAHFLVSGVLVAVSTWLLLRSGEGDAAPRADVRPQLRWTARALAAVGALVLVLGTLVTGSGPHSGDARDPARFGFDPRVVSWLHADAVILFVGVLAALLLGMHLTGAPALARRRGAVLLGVTVGQGGIGYVQYFTGLPEVLVALHMLGACLLVVALTALVHAMRERPVARVEPRTQRRMDAAAATVPT